MCDQADGTRVRAHTPAASPPDAVPTPPKLCHQSLDSRCQDLPGHQNLGSLVRVMDTAQRSAVGLYENRLNCICHNFLSRIFMVKVEGITKSGT